ncbi:FecR family protein [Pedobacter gandavensis]|uniref:FecR family protein n=1 Tax=Pedobacter gandavensis TaxID=2679963 RepID=UPI002930B56F|nr:FecR domain-containing protein [Pedobacter gandavensis]
MQITKELIERYHQGQCNPEEQEAIAQWLESDEVEMSYPTQVNLTALQDKGWKKIAGRYNLAIPALASQSFKWNNYRRILQLAACFLVFVSIATLYALNREGLHHAKAVPAYKMVKAKKGQKLQVTLPDGTLVWLNSESVLRFPESFEGKQRELEFSGEGYFEVAKDPSKPFVIHTAKTNVQVLGTRFNLRALGSESSTSVVVAEGKVRFTGKRGGQPIILTANRRGVFEQSAPSARMMISLEAETGAYIAWKNNELLLDNLTIAEVAETLERWYNVKIKISNTALAKERYTGNFKNPTLNQVLESMSFAVKFNYRQDQQTFIFY